MFKVLQVQNLHIDSAAAAPFRQSRIQFAGRIRRNEAVSAENGIDQFRAHIAPGLSGARRADDEHVLQLIRIVRPAVGDRLFAMLGKLAVDRREVRGLPDVLDAENLFRFLFAHPSRGSERSICKPVHAALILLHDVIARIIPKNSRQKDSGKNQKQDRREPFSFAECIMENSFRIIPCKQVHSSQERSGRNHCRKQRSRTGNNHRFHPFLLHDLFLLLLLRIAEDVLSVIPAAEFRQRPFPVDADAVC